MKKLLFVLTIIFILYLIYNYSRETFQGDPTPIATATVSDENSEIMKNIGYMNLNEHNAISCTLAEGEKPDDGSPITVPATANYSSCFNEDTENKFIEVDTENNKCNIYTSLNCSGDGDHKILNNLEFTNKVIFYKKSRKLLFTEYIIHSSSDATATGTTATGTTATGTTATGTTATGTENITTRVTKPNLISVFIKSLNIENTTDSVKNNINEFKGNISDFDSKLINQINYSNHLNINDLYCCLAEHLFVIRLSTPQNIGESVSDNGFTYDKLNKRISELDLNKLLANVIKSLGVSKLNNDKIINSYKKPYYNNGTHARLCYNYETLKVLLLLIITKFIKEDNFLEKYNSKYITYLFYSFKRSHKMWNSYFISVIDRLNLHTSIYNEIKGFITKQFFDNPNNENIYKIFIYINGLLNFPEINYYNDTDIEKKLIQFDGGVLRPIESISDNRYVFYFNNEFVDTNDICKNANDNESECNKLDKYGCKYDKTNNKCHGRYEFQNCMQYTNEDSCKDVSHGSCEYNTDDNFCKPKDCFSDTECQGELNHCNKIHVESNDKLWDACYDNVRTVKGGDSTLPINDNFYNKTDNILDKCINKIYEEGIEGTVSRKSDEDILESCKDGCIVGNYNKVKTCVDKNLINNDNFFDGYYCNNIKYKSNCDATELCFWEGNKCYPNTGKDDTMVCNDFNTQERCPKNNCVWYDSRCNQIYDNDNNILATTQSIPPSVEIKEANCSAINHSGQDNSKKKNECVFNNCDWNEDRNLCVDTINKGCVIKNEQECIDRKLNYDSITNRNRCKLLVDPDDLSKKTCVDNNEKIPCKYYSMNDCPTDNNPKVNFHGEIVETSYCDLNINKDKCIDKDASENESCIYNYLKDGGASNNYSKNCREVELLVKNADNSQTSLDESKTTRMVTGVFHREHLPCSLLDENNCSYKNNTKKCKQENKTCFTNEGSFALFDKLRSVTDINRYKDFNEIIDRVSDIYQHQNEKALCRYDSQVHGKISNLGNYKITVPPTNISSINNFIILYVNVDLEDLDDVIYKEAKTIGDKNKLLDSINSQLKSQIKLSNNSDLQWISNKYKITSVDPSSDKSSKDNDISVSNNIYRNIELATINVGPSESIQIKVPISKAIKWFIPNPLADINECLDDVILKNLDSRQFFKF